MSRDCLQVYWALRDEVVAHEQVLLRGMAFDAELTSAYANLTEPCAESLLSPFLSLT